MIDTTLLNTLKELADKERNIKEFKRRLRIKGKITKKGTTKKGNITLNIKKNDDEYKFIVLHSHKERFALAQKLNIGNSISITGIPKIKIIICTKLKLLTKEIDESKQTTLEP